MLLGNSGTIDPQSIRLTFEVRDRQNGEAAEGTEKSSFSADSLDREGRFVYQRHHDCALMGFVGCGMVCGIAPAGMPRPAQYSDGLMSLVVGDFSRSRFQKS